MLYVVRCMLFVDCCLMFVVCCWLLVAFSLMLRLVWFCVLFCYYLFVARRCPLFVVRRVGVL